MTASNACSSCARHVAVTLVIEPSIVRGRRLDPYRLCVRCWMPEPPAVGNARKGKA